jgi:hypothetical protein
MHQFHPEQALNCVFVRDEAKKDPDTARTLAASLPHHPKVIARVLSYQNILI